MNPPYGREIGHWVDLLYDEWQAGHVEEAIALLPARTDTKWIRRLRQLPRCFIAGRLRFHGAHSGAPFPSVLVYFGDNSERFIDAFRDIGDTYRLA